MPLTLIQEVAALLSGMLVGGVLGLIGGGGSILAVPLLIEFVGVRDTHVAIGTASLAVAANAFVALIIHARSGTVKWPCASVFAASGIAGAAIGSTIGKHIDGPVLLLLFALAVIAVAVNLLRRQEEAGDPAVHLTPAMAPRLAATGLVVGAVSGLFGIGGGFLVVPGLISAVGMATLNAIGSSLLGVGAFGVTTAVNYALSGFIDWWIALLFLAGGAVGSYAGMLGAHRLARRRGALRHVFAVVLIGVAALLLWRGATGLGWIEV